MFECLAIGDSIAVGIGKEMQCEIRAHVGWSSKQIIKLADGSKAELCIISAGSNDPKNPNLILNLKTIRDKIDCMKVVWINPIDDTASQSVIAAAKYEDSIVSFEAGKDKVHPKSYKNLSLFMKKVLTYSN